MTDFVLAPKQALAVIVMIAFIMVCVLAPFGAAHAIVGVSTAAITILIAALAAAGITFTTTGAFDTLEEYVESLLQEYGTDNNIPVTSVFNGASWQASAAGKLLLNNVFVREISAIATWIKVKYNLLDNSSYDLVVPGSSYGSLTVYNLPYSGEYGNNYYTVYSASHTPVYVTFYRINNSGPIYPYFFSAEPFVAYSTNYHNGNPTGESGSRASYYDTSLGMYPYYTINVGQSLSTSRNPDIVWVNLTNSNFPTNMKDYFDGDDIVETDSVGIGINTGNIDIPTDRTDYTGESGAILDVHAPWSIPVSGVIDTIPDAWSSVEDDTTIYTLDLEAEAVIEQQLPQPSDIENLPGATIPGIPDIDGEPWHLEFSNLWHYVAQWISDMSAGGAVIWNTCVQAPPPVVNLVFVGIVLAMWFGAIKILR